MGRAIRPLFPLILVVTVCTVAVLGVRRRKNALVSSRLESSVSVLGAAAPSASAEPPFFGLHGSARRTHRGASVGPQRAHVAWTTEVGAPVQTQVVPSRDGTTLYVATLAGELWALSKEGVVLWKVLLGERLYSTPCVDEAGTIYVGSDNHRLFAVSPKGVVTWSFDAGDEVDTSPLLLEDGNLVFAAGKRLMALSKNGDARGVFEARGKIFTSPTLTPSGTIVFGSQDDRVYGVDRTLKRVFETDVGGDVDGTAVVSDEGVIYVGTDRGEIVALNPAGTIRLRISLGGYIRGALSLARNGDVLAGVYGPTPALVRVQPDGQVVFRYAVPSTGSRDFGVHGGALEDAAGTLYFGAQDDRVSALGSSGTPLWAYKTGGDVDAPVTLLPGGRLIVASDDGKVYCFED